MSRRRRGKRTRKATRRNRTVSSPKAASPKRAGPDDTSPDATEAEAPPLAPMPFVGLPAEGAGLEISDAELVDEDLPSSGSFPGAEDGIEPGDGDPVEAAARRYLAHAERSKARRIAGLIVTQADRAEGRRLLVELAAVTAAAVAEPEHD